MDDARGGGREYDGIEGIETRRAIYFLFGHTTDKKDKQ